MVILCVGVYVHIVRAPSIRVMDCQYNIQKYTDDILVGILKDSQHLTLLVELLAICTQCPYLLPSTYSNVLETETMHFTFHSMATYFTSNRVYISVYRHALGTQGLGIRLCSISTVNLITGGA